jgi:hypothetical protein
MMMTLQKVQSSPPLPGERVSQVRSWFDRLTTNGQRHLRNQLLSRSS